MNSDERARMLRAMWGKGGAKSVLGCGDYFKPDVTLDAIFEYDFEGRLTGDTFNLIGIPALQVMN